jgi:hypothetical protein
MNSSYSKKYDTETVCSKRPGQRVRGVARERIQALGLAEKIPASGVPFLFFFIFLLSLFVIPLAPQSRAGKENPLATGKQGIGRRT